MQRAWPSQHHALKTAVHASVSCRQAANALRCRIVSMHSVKRVCVFSPRQFCENTVTNALKRLKLALLPMMTVVMF